MFKKTLLAATVAATFSTSALAMVVTSNEGTFQNPATPVASKIANQTKQVPLNVVTYSETINVQLDNTATDLNQSEVKDRAIFAIQLSGEAGMNDKGIQDFLKGVNAAGDVETDETQVVNAVGIDFEVDGTNNQKFHVIGNNAYPVFTATSITLDDGQDPATAVNLTTQEIYKDGDLYKLVADATIDAGTEKEYPANSVVAKVDGSTDSTPLVDGAAGDLSAIANVALGSLTLKDVLKYDDAADRFEYVIDGSTLKLQLSDNIRTVTAGQKLNLTFKFNEANQAFRLQKGSNADTTMTMGVLSDGSYTAGPEQVGKMFDRVDLFTLGYAANPSNKDSIDATALVSKGFTQWAAGADSQTVTNSALNTRAAVLQNQTSAQNIQKKFVSYQLLGDFSGIAMDAENGSLLGNTNWKVNEDGTALTFTYPSTNTDNISGFVGQDGKGSETNKAASSKDDIAALAFRVLENNSVQIPAQSFELKATVSDNPTFTEYSQTLGNIFNVKRDGLRFDTVTTGTTSANVIYIRDIDGITTGEGKVYVTITEYDEHGAQQNGEGSILTTDANGNPGPAELSVTLPKNGALTLTPAGVAEMVGAEINPERQARFVFDVETNMGEAAVKKNTSDGVDIQTGSQPENKSQLDFTL